MIQSKPLFTKVIMSALTVALSSFAVLGSGSILAVIARYKSLRTVPNVLIGNLAAVDLLNAVIYMPIQITYSVLEVSCYRGQALAIATSLFNRLFAILNLASMLVLLANMYFAIAFDLKYCAWKSNKKAVVCVCVIWFLGIILAVLPAIPQLGIDLGDADVREYRQEFFKRGKHFVAAFIAFCIIACAVLGFLTIRSIRKKKKKIAEMNLPALQAQSRLQRDIKATKTIAFTVAAYFACYVPTIAYAVAGQQDGSDANSWFSFFVWLALFFSSAMNPIIYYVRSRRFRCAFKQFIKDPFGSSALQEKSSGKAREKRNPEGAAIPWENGNEEGDGYHRDEDQAIKNYHGQRRDGIMILSMQALQAHLCAIDNGGSSGEGRVKQQKGEAPGSTSSFPEPVQREACVSNHQIYDGGSSSRGEGRAKQQKGEASGTTRSFPEPCPVIEQREACASNPQIKEPIEDMFEEIQEFFLADNASLKERNLPRELAGTSGYRPEEKQEIPAQCLEEEITVAYRPQQVSSGVDVQESAKDTPQTAVDRFLEALEERDKIT